MLEEVISEYKGTLTSSGSFPSCNGKERLYFKSLTPKESYEYHLIWLHDFIDYHGRYLELSKKLSQHFKNDLRVTLIDFKGFGLSSGTRGTVQSIEELAQDIVAFYNHFEQNGHGKKIILGGQGLGAEICLAVAHFYEKKLVAKPCGLVLSNPYIKFSLELPNVAGNFWNGISNFLNKVRIPLNFTGKDFTTQRDKASEYDTDPLVNHFISLGLLNGINDLGKRLRKVSYFIDIPTLYLLSGHSKLCDLDTARLFYKGMPKETTSLVEFENMLHDIFNEVRREKVFNTVTKWLEDNLIKKVDV